MVGRYGDEPMDNGSIAPGRHRARPAGPRVHDQVDEAGASAIGAVDRSAQSRASS
jgi:hypothetical protein